MTYRIPDVGGYYPSARCRFIIRLEDFGRAGTPEPPARIPTLRKGGKDLGVPGKLRVEEQDGRLVLVAPGTSTAAQLGGPQDQTSSSDGLTHVIDGVVPQSATWEENGIRTADTLTLTLKLADFPFDPRCLRSIAVKFFLGCVPASEFARGVAGEFRPPERGGSALSFGTVPDSYVDRNGRLRTNERFLGFVTKNSMVLDEDAGTIEMDCVDNTSLFLGTEHPGQLAVDPKKPIDAAIAGYLASFPQFVGMSVEFRPHVEDAKKPRLVDVMGAAAAQKGKGPPQGAGQKVLVWDYLTDTCVMLGLILRVEGTTLVVQRPRTFFGDGFRREDDPYRGRVIEGRGQPPLVLPVRMYAYGANAIRLSIGRNMDRSAPKNVEVRSYSTARKKTIIVRYPEKSDRVKSMLPGQTGTDLKFIVKTVHGVEDPATLKIIAQAQYEVTNRNEFDIQLDSTNLGSFGGDNLDPDLLDVREGDAIQVQVARNETEESSAAVQNLGWATQAELEALGFPRAFVSAYVRTRDQLTLPTTFRLVRARFQWESGKGVKASLNLANYVVASIGKELPASQEIQPSDVQPGPDRVEVDEALG